jgi:hypothetical protein
MQCLVGSFASILGMSASSRLRGNLGNAVVRSPIEGIALALAGRPTIKSLSISGATTRLANQPMKSAAPKNEFHKPIQRDLGRPACAPKIFRFSFFPNQLHLGAIPPHRRGAYASSRYVECGLRWTRGRSRARGIAGRSQALSWGCERSIRAGRAALLRTAKACGSGTRGWCQAGGGCSNPTGFDQPSIRQRRRQKEFVSGESAP